MKKILLMSLAFTAATLHGMDFLKTKPLIPNDFSQFFCQQLAIVLPELQSRNPDPQATLILLAELKHLDPEKYRYGTLIANYQAKKKLCQSLNIANTLDNYLIRDFFTAQGPTTTSFSNIFGKNQLKFEDFTTPEKLAEQILSQIHSTSMPDLTELKDKIKNFKLELIENLSLTTIPEIEEMPMFKQIFADFYKQFPLMEAVDLKVNAANLKLDQLKQKSDDIAKRTKQDFVTFKQKLDKEKEKIKAAERKTYLELIANMVALPISLYVGFSGTSTVSNLNIANFFNNSIIRSGSYLDTVKNKINDYVFNEGMDSIVKTFKRICKI